MKKLQEIVNVTRKLVPGYFESTCRQRLTGGAGSCFEGISTIEEMEENLLKAKWSQIEDENVTEGCTAYVTTDIPGGRFGLVEIKDLPDETVLVADDRKGTGKVSLTVSGQKGAYVQETYLIIGPEQGEDVVFTFHPGPPVRESKVQTSELPHGTEISKAKALEMGFELAKLV